MFTLFTGTQELHPYPMYHIPFICHTALLSHEYSICLPVIPIRITTYPIFSNYQYAMKKVLFTVLYH